LKVNYVKIRFLVIFFICLFSFQLSNAEVVWSEDFDDGDYNGWSTTQGAFAVEEGYLRSTVDMIEEAGFELMSIAYYPSTVAFGTWSFDFMIESETKGHPDILVEFVSLTKNRWSYSFANGQCIGFTIGPMSQKDPEQDRAFFEIFKNVDRHSVTWLEFLEFPIPERNEWHHVDITRDKDGHISVFLNGELKLEATNKDYSESRYFGVWLEYSSKGQTIIDNIVVSDTVDIEPPEKEQSSQIPGFPIESLIVGLVLVILLLRFRK
jgi:hypothetical protein